jgi:hypothetical protein
MTNSKYFKSINEKLNKINKNKPVFKTGNLKIGYNTIIFNIGSAHDCISAKLVLCQFKNINKNYYYLKNYKYVKKKKVISVMVIRLKNNIKRY